MTDYDHLSMCISPLIRQFDAKSVLIVGEIAKKCYPNRLKTRVQSLLPPFQLEQLHSLQAVDLAIVSTITDTLNQQEATQWLGTLRNRYAPHILIISDIERSTQQGWQLNDYLALGMTQIKALENYHIYLYSLTNYQRKKEWLNSKFWANPEIFDKYRW